MSLQTNDFYEFDEFRIDAMRRVLLRGGDVVPLTPKDFDVLLALVQRAGEDLSIDKLLKIVWGDEDVEVQNITLRVNRIRKILGDTPTEHRYIVTVPKFGYRFVGKVNYTTTREPPTGPELKDGAGPMELDLSSADFHVIAASNASRSGLNQEAIRHARKGLEIVCKLPESPARLQKELLLLSTMGVPMMTIDGYASPDVERTYDRIGKICRQLNESVLPVPVLWGMWLFNHVRKIPTC